MHVYARGSIASVELYGILMPVLCLIYWVYIPKLRDEKINRANKGTDTAKMIASHSVIFIALLTTTSTIGIYSKKCFMFVPINQSYLRGIFRFFFVYFGVHALYGFQTWPDARRSCTRNRYRIFIARELFDQVKAYQLVFTQDSLNA